MYCKILLMGLMAFTLVACKPAAESTELPSTANTADVDPVEIVERVLASGIDQDGFDTSVRPQDDLFLYANGAWLEQTEIPGDKSRWGPFMKLAEKSQ